MAPRIAKTPGKTRTKAAHVRSAHSSRKPRVKIAPVSKKKPSDFQKFEGNPVLSPREGVPWESKATFNPAAMRAGGKIHLLYRAIGDNDISVLGYAGSSDAFSFAGRGEEPAFAPHKIKASDLSERPPVIYGSGGGWNGGCEDPRLALLDGTVYLLYTAFDGWGSVRIAMTSISPGDFLNRRWKNWKKPALISPEGEIHKNWVLFPEKINGKYAILHSISPKVLVDYFDNLDELRLGEKEIKSSREMVPREGSWDYLTRGAGPPPIKTKDGWLLLYHAIEKHDPGSYKLGAMLLDFKNPAKVLYRSHKPILEPDEYYEKHGFKGGVIYSCGAVAVGNDIFVYYGAADTVACVATAKLDKFLSELKSGKKPELSVKGAAKHAGH